MQRKIVMNILFKNEFTRTPDAYRALNKYWYFKRPFPVVCFCYFALYILGLIWAAINALVEPSTFIICFLTVAALSGLYIFTYFRQIKMTKKRDIEMMGKPEYDVSLTIDNEQITHTAGDCVNTVKLSSIKKAFRNEGYLFLLTEAKLTVILKEDSFTVGSLDELLTFLSERSIKVKK